ncbi:MAG: response regulator [Bacteroidales bacterium]|nr:response regulator [Bacteroidales bacterium]
MKIFFRVLLGICGVLVLYYLLALLGIAPQNVSVLISTFFLLLSFPFVARFQLSQKEIVTIALFVFAVILDAYLATTPYSRYFGIGQVGFGLLVFYIIKVQSRYVRALKDAESLNKINEALSEEFVLVFLADMMEQKVQVNKISNFASQAMLLQKEQVIEYDDFVRRVVQNIILPEDVKSFKVEYDFDTLLNRLKSNREYISTWPVNLHGSHHIYQIVCRKLLGTNKIIIAVRNIDNIIDKEKEQKIALENALNVAKDAMSTRLDFLKYMSRDIRVPMNDIVGLTTLAVNHIDNKEKVLDYLKKIQNSSNVLLAHVLEVLDEHHFHYERTREEVLHDIKSEQHVEGKDEYDLKGVHILLVEDNETNREIADMLLSEYGAEVDALCDGAEAVERLESPNSKRYDVILMDIEMPVMNGYEATRRIRSLSNKRKAATPIIALTANASEDDKIASKESGMNGHVAKPFDIQEMVREINRLI